MSEKVDQSDAAASLLGGLVLAVLGLGAIAVIVSVLKAIVELIVNLVEFLVLTAIKLVAISLGLALLLVLLALLGDLLAIMALTFMRRQRYRRSVLGSSFPYHEQLNDPRTLSGYFFTKVDFYLGDCSARVHSRRRPFWVRNAETFRRWQNDKIDGYQRLRENLLADAQLFRTFWIAHAFKILRSRQTDFVLLNIYNALWARFQYEAQNASDATRLSQAICCKITTQPTRRGARFTRATLALLSMGHVRFDSAQRALTAANRREQVEHYLISSAAFRDFMDRYLFEVLDECRGMRTNPFDFSAESADVHERQQNARHYALLPDPIEWADTICLPRPRLLPKAPPRSPSAGLPSRDVEPEPPRGETAADIELYRAAALALTEELQRQELQRKYLGDLTPELLYHQLKDVGEDQFAFADAMREVLLEAAESREEAEEELGRLRDRRSAFLTFWSQHEDVILKYHDERQRWVGRATQATSQTLQQRAEHDAAIERHLQAVHSLRDEYSRRAQTGEAVVADETYGCLMATGYQRVDELRAAGEIPFADSASFEREIRRLLEAPECDAQYFAVEHQWAVTACNAYRARTLPYGDLVRDAGVQPDSDLWQSILAFRQHNEGWRRRHDARQERVTAQASEATESNDAHVAGAEFERARRRQAVRRESPASGEKCYTVQEVAAMWNMSDDSIRALFENEPGVLIMQVEKRGKRPYRTIRIPESVLQRVQRRMMVPAV